MIYLSPSELRRLEDTLNEGSALLEQLGRTRDYSHALQWLFAFVFLFASQAYIGTLNGFGFSGIAVGFAASAVIQSITDFCVRWHLKRRNPK